MLFRSVGHPTVNFTEYFEEILFQKAQGTFTYFVAPNQYDDFVELLTRYQDKGNPFVWFYPVADESKPEVPAALESCVEVLYEH